MSDVKDNRRANFRRVVQGLGGPRETAIKLDMNESQVSQLISDTVGKAMGDRLARRIERSAGLSLGDLDMATSPDGRRHRNVPLFTIDDLDSGRDPASHRALIWDNSNPYTPKDRLLAVVSDNDALTGLMGEGDIGIFDAWPLAAKPRSLKPGSIVLARPADHHVVRILKQSPSGGWDLLATSSLYAPMHIPDLSSIHAVLVEIRWLTPRALSNV